METSAKKLKNKSENKKLKHNRIKLILESDKYKIKKNESFFELQYFMKHLHPNLNDGYSSVLILPEEQRWSVGGEDYINQLGKFIGVEDFYCSVNDLVCPGRHSGRYLKRLNAFWVDLDYYKVPHLKGLNPAQIVGLMEMDLNFPTPSFIVDSGNGIYLIWLIETLYAGQSYKKDWDKVEREIIKFFGEFGADTSASDSARVLRMVGSINSRTGRTVKLHEINKDDNGNPIRYDLNDLKDFFVGVEDLFANEVNTSPKKVKKAVKKAPKSFKRATNVLPLKNKLTLNQDRAEDLERLVEMRTGQAMEGCRNQLLMLYRFHLTLVGMSEQDSLQACLELNSKFYDALPEREVTTSTKSAIRNFKKYEKANKEFQELEGVSFSEFMYQKKIYFFKNEWIIDELGITQDEMKYLLTIINDDERKRRKQIKNRNDYAEDKKSLEYYYENKKDISEKRKQKYQEKLKIEGKMSKNEQLNILYDKIKSLKQQGLKNKEIEKELGLATSTLKRHITNMKKNGLL